MDRKLVDILACPDCQIKIVLSEDTLFCPNCSREFPVVNGIPVLFSKYSQLVQQQGEQFFGGETKTRQLHKKLPPFLTRVPNTFIKPARHEVVYDQYIRAAGEGQILLNLGSGSEITHTKERAKGNATIVNMDIYPHSGVHIAADGHQLPFVDEAFDGVYMVAVLEHLSNPFRVAQEVSRVLKNGGFVFVAAPFIYPIHGSPSDYFRFTDDGLRQLFPNFVELDCAAHGLPTRGLIEFLKVYTASFFSNRYLAYAISYIVSYFLYPLKYLDKYLQKKEKAHYVCSSFYYVGRKELTDGH